MRKLVLFAVLVGLYAMPSMAQNAPKGEVFAGYAYTRINPGQGLNGENANGWMGSVAGNFNDWFGIVGDFSGAYKTISGTKVHAHFYTFGPRLSYRKSDKVTPFAHVTFGGAHLGGSGVSENGFAMTLGGGVDVKAGNHVAVRLGQLDYILTRFDGPVSGTRANQHNFRYAAGIVFRFGGK